MEILGIQDVSFNILEGFVYYHNGVTGIFTVNTMQVVSGTALFKGHIISTVCTLQRGYGAHEEHA